MLALYARDVAPKLATPKATAGIIGHLLGFFGEKMLVEVNGPLCREYGATCFSDSVARNNLAILRAAINHHRKEGLCLRVIEVPLPPPRPGRERWLTRTEAAKIIRAAWRYRETQDGAPTKRHPRRHAAKFALVALYTGTRAGLVCGAALEPTAGHGWIDLDRGVFYRKPARSVVTKKRAPPVPLPDRLLAHLRRWKRQGQKFVVEYNGRPVKQVGKAFRATVSGLGLEDGVMPHTLRHTAATWMMQAGVDPWEAAGYLGMTVETLLNRYGHHHPKHLANAKNAFEKLRIVGHIVGPKPTPKT